MKKILFVVLLLVTTVLVWATGQDEEGAAAVQTENYSLGTGGQSGIYYPFGGAVAELWSTNIDGLNVKAEVTSASVENTIKVVAGKMIAGFAQANVVIQAYEGTGKFTEKQPVAILATLYPNLTHVILPANTSVRSLEDLKGKKISLGAPGSGTAVTAENLLKTNGITLDDIDELFLNYSETTNAIANGQIEAGFIVGGLGVGAITELALTKDIILLSLSESEINNFITANNVYKPARVDADVYNNVAAFNTVAVWNTIVVREDMDEDLAYNLVKIIYENNDYLTQVVKSAFYTTVENANQVDKVPLHPGTKKYLSEMQ